MNQSLKAPTRPPSPIPLSTAAAAAAAANTTTVSTLALSSGARHKGQQRDIGDEEKCICECLARPELE
jgi:hypothetical protein